jgi:hypothetical protein
MVSGCLTLIWQLGLRFGSQEEVDITQGLEADFSLQGFASGQFTCIYMYAKRISHLQEIGKVERTGWSVIVLECHRILSYIYLGYWCRSSVLSSLVAEHCCMIFYFNNQTDQGEEREGLDMEGLEMEDSHSATCSCISALQYSTCIWK